MGPHTHTPAPAARGWRTPTARPVGGQSGGGGAPDLTRPSQRWKAPPPGDALPPHPLRATPARKGARSGAAAGSPRAHRPHPEHTGRGTPAVPPRGRAAGGGTAPDTRRPSQLCRATPLGDGPLPTPRHEAPTGHAGQGDRDGPPHPHARARSTWGADHNSPPSGRAAGGGGAPDLRRASQRWQAPPPGTAPRQPRGTQPPQGRAGQEDSVGPPHPHARTHSMWVVDPNSPPSGRAVGGGGAPDIRRPSQQWKAPRRGRPSATPKKGAQPQARKGGTGTRPPPPQARQTEHGTGAGHAEGLGPRGTALPAPSAGSARGAHATPPRGGGADAAGAPTYTHAKGTRGLPEGQPDQARGTHRLRGMAYQRARVRDTRTGGPATHSAEHAGQEGGNGRDTTPGTSPSPPNRPRAPRTHGRGTAPAKAVMAHCATPQPLG